MDEQSIPDDQPTFDVPGILTSLVKIEAVAMKLAMDNRYGMDVQLHALQVVHQLLINRLLAIETRDIQQSQRHLERAIARDRGHRDGLGSDW